MLSKTQADILAKEFEAGYWIVGGYCFFDKVQASVYATLNGFDSLKYHFFDDVYSRLGTGKEPAQSLDDLYDARARQLRDKHSHIILAVSGGSDSTAVLLSFLRQGLKVDEIWTYFPIKVIEKLRHTFDPSNKSTSQHMFEYDTAFLPLMELVKVKSPSTKIRVFDFTEHLTDTIISGKVEKLHHGKQLLHPGTAGPDMMFTALQQYNGKSAALVIGCDKPRILYHDDKKKFYFCFNDFQNFWATANMKMGVGAPRIETFYYTPAMPEIVQKQYFVIRDRLKALRDISSPLYNTLWKPNPNGKNVHNFDIQHEFFEHIIYPSNPNHGVFQTQKPTSIFYNTDADWAIGATPLVDLKVRDFWSGQIKEFIHGISDDLITFSAGKPALLKHVVTMPIGFP